MINQVSKNILSKGLFNKRTNNIRSGIFRLNNNKFFLFYNGKYDLKKDYYGILGLSKQANQSQIKKEYYNLAKQYHPDVNKSSNQKFKLINEAYSVLSDQKLKAEYDQARRSQQAQQRFQQKRQQYRQQYQQHYYRQYRNAYEEMDQYDRYLLRKQFTRIMIRLFLFGFGITILFTMMFGGPRRLYVDEFGRPVDASGRPIDRYGRPINYSLYQPYPPPVNDPYGLGGNSRGPSSQNIYGQQSVGPAPTRENYY